MNNPMRPTVRPVFRLTTLTNDTVSTTSGTIGSHARQKTDPQSGTQATNHRFPEAPHVALLTLGCAKNEVDSRVMRKQLEEQGFIVSENVEDAHFILLNTCAFIEAAVEESLDTILELSALERVQSGEARLLVAGCLPSRYGEELTQELPEVTAFIPLAEEARVAELLKEMLYVQGDQEDGAECLLMKKPHVQQPSLDTRTLDPRPWAHVKISDGCSRHCSYCTIPSIRGSYHSYPYEAINIEVRNLVAEGVREIILVGQDTGLWSSATPKDQGRIGEKKKVLEDPQSLAGLLDALANEYPETWFRVMYLQPEGITDELLEVMGSHTNIARYLDIPLQHANKDILAAMNRRGSGSEYLRLVQRVREKLPGATVRTTVIVGFPGESQKAFDELYDFLEAVRFDFVGIFAYSCEEGTAAANLPHKVDEKTALARLQDLRDATDTIGFELAAEQAGNVVDVLICGQDEEGIFGRTMGQAPDVDGLTYVVLPADKDDMVIPDDADDEVLSADTDDEVLLADKYDEMHPLAAPAAKPVPGTIVRARIIESVLYDLFVEVIPKVQ